MNYFNAKSILLLAVLSIVQFNLHAMDPFTCKVPTNEQRAVQQQAPEDREYAAQRETKRLQAQESAAQELSVSENTKPQLNIPASGLPKEDQRLADGLAILYQLPGSHGPGLPVRLKKMVLEYCPRLEIVKKFSDKAGAQEIMFGLFGKKDYDQEASRLFNLLNEKFPHESHTIKQCLYFSPPENQYYTVKCPGLSWSEIQIHNFTTKALISSLRHDKPVSAMTACSFSNRQWYLISGEHGSDTLTGKNSIYIWDAKTGKLIRKLANCVNGAIKKMGNYMNNDKEWFIVAYSLDNMIRIFNGETGELVKAHAIKTGMLSDLAIQKKGECSWNIITTGGPDLEIFDALTYELLDSFKIDTTTDPEAYFKNMVHFRCNDGRFLIITQSSDGIRVFDYSATSATFDEAFNQTIDNEIGRSIVQDLSNSEFPQKGLPAKIQRIMYDYVVTQADKKAEKDKEQAKLAAEKQPVAAQSSSSYCAVQ